MAGDPVIVCENLVKIYKIAGLEVVALQGLDLSIERGELLGIVGSSGSGKSTLMNILGGLDRPSAGRVWVDGQDLLKLSDAGLDRYRRARVGFVWQHGARNLVPYLSAVENVAIPLTLAGAPAAQKRRQAGELLELVGLAARRGHRLSQLSGGEQQRVAIAVALANRPTLLLADEPTGEVDTEAAARLFGVFRDLKQRLGVTILIVSHDPSLAHQVDRVVAIRDGKTSSETLRQPAGRSDAGRSEAGAEAVFEELTVLDSAGRLQVPKDLLERFQIQGRARLEATERGILILPAAHGSQATPPPAAELKNPAANRGILRKFFHKGQP